MATTEKEFYDDLNKQFMEDEKRYELMEENQKEEFKIMLKDQINIESLFEYLDDGLYWKPIGIVEIKLTEEKRSRYSGYQHARIIDDEDKLLYMKTSTDGDVEDVEYYYVWQQTGCMEDDFSGYMLFQMNDGKFFKVSYFC